MKKGAVINIACATILVLLSAGLYYYSYKTSSSIYLYAGFACTFFALILFYSRLLPDSIFKKNEEELPEEEFETAKIVEIDDNDKPIDLKKSNPEIRSIVRKSLILQKEYYEEHNFNEFIIRARCTPGSKSFNIENPEFNTDNVDRIVEKIFSKESDRLINEIDILCDKSCKVSVYVNGHITVDYNNIDKDAKDLADHIKDELKKITNKTVVIGTYIVNTNKKASK